MGRVDCGRQSALRLSGTTGWRLVAASLLGAGVGHVPVSLLSLTD